MLLTLFLAATISHSENVTKADIDALKETRANKVQRQTRFQQQLNDNQQRRKALQRENAALEIDLKQLNQETRKIESLSSNPPSSSDKQQLSKLAYKRRVAEINLNKNKADIKEMEADQEQIVSRINRLNRVLSSLDDELVTLEQQYNNSSAAKAQAAKEEKQRQQQLAKQRAKDKKYRQQQAQAQKKRDAERHKKQAAKQQRSAEQQRQQALEAEAAKLAQMTQGMHPAQAALTRAQYVAKQPMQGAPALGNSPSLQVANPVGSSEKHLSKMRHLGNHQYSTTITVKKGRQQYIVGEHKFIKSIPKHFNGISCLILIDARDNQAKFQLIATGQ